MNHTRAVVIGAGLADQYGVVPGEIRTITLNGIDYGVVGVLDKVALDPNLDNAAFVTQWAADHDFATEGEPTKMYVRSQPGTTSAVADAIPTAISLGSTDSVTTKIPSDALEASAQADETLQQTALFAGILALAVGGLGIANVMSISVIQRSSEIGIRRALGSTRSLIALQFLLEALFVGILGGMIGALVGVGVVYLVSGLAGLGGGHRLRPHAAVDRARGRGVGRGRPLPVGEGGTARTTRDAPPRLTITFPVTPPS